MLSYGSGALLVEAALFLGVAAVSSWEYLRSKQQSAVVGWGAPSGGGDGSGGGGGGGHNEHQCGPQTGMTLLQSEAAESDNSGTKARHRVNVILAVACAARALLNVGMSATGGSVAGVPYLAVPDLLYIALYCYLTALLAGMRQIIVASKTRHAVLRPAVWWSFGAVLLASLVVCSVRWGAGPGSKKSLVLRKFLYFELGATYLVMFVTFLYFGVRLCACMAVSNKRLFYRILVLTLVCGVAMCTKGAFFFVAAIHNRDTESVFPGLIGRDCFEALVALEELLPSIVIAFLTARGKGRRHRAEVFIRTPETTRIIVPTGWHDLYSNRFTVNTNGSGVYPAVATPPAVTPGTGNMRFSSYGSSTLNQA